MVETPKTESRVTRAAASARKNLWKFFGALVMEEKNGSQAISLHKVLGLSTYVACMWLWLHPSTVTQEVQVVLDAAKIDIPAALKAAKDVPESMLYTLWALLAINGGSKIATIVKGGQG